MTKIKCPSCETIFIKEEQEVEWEPDGTGLIRCPECDDFMSINGIDYWKVKEAEEAYHRSPDYDKIRQDLKDFEERNQDGERTG